MIKDGRGVMRARAVVFCVCDVLYENSEVLMGIGCFCFLFSGIARVNHFGRMTGIYEYVSFVFSCVCVCACFFSFFRCCFSFPNLRFYKLF